MLFNKICSVVSTNICNFADNFLSTNFNNLFFMLMKKFTFLMIALLTAVVTFAAGPKKQFAPQLFTNAKAQVQLGNQFRAKQAPARLAKQTKGTAMARAPKKAATAADLAGTYLWEYQTAKDYDTDLESLETTAGSA